MFIPDDLELGIPSIDELLGTYTRMLNLNPIHSKDWTFYQAFTFFRMSSIMQGVYKRALQGQASQQNAVQYGHIPKFSATVGLKIIQDAEVPLEKFGKIPSIL